jgi:hypothetical protein
MYIGMHACMYVCMYSDFLPHPGPCHFDSASTNKTGANNAAALAP